MNRLVLGILSIIVMMSFTAKCNAYYLTVLLDHHPKPDHAALLVAEKQGFFKAEQINVFIIDHTKPKVTPDILVLDEPSFIQKVEAGAQLVSIGTLIDQPLTCLAALKSTGIHQMTDLKGKKIGITQDPVSLALLTAMLNNAGLKTTDVTLIKFSIASTEALVSHQVDAFMGLTRNLDVPDLEKKGHVVTTFFPEDHGAPTYSELIFATKKSNIHDARFSRFLQAVKKAVEYMDTHPHDIDKDWVTTLPYFAEEPNRMDVTDWNQFIAFMLKHHLINQSQDASTYLKAL